MEVRRLLANEAALRELAKSWHQSATWELVESNKPLLDDVIRVVMHELGEDEFETRVGVTEEIALAFLSKVH